MERAELIQKEGTRQFLLFSMMIKLFELAVKSQRIWPLPAQCDRKTKRTMNTSN